MRITRLDLERFGHFRAASLSFGDGRSLALVHGDNEAGKTTVLEAIRWLLFGGPGARFVFDDDAAKIAVGARMELATGAVDIRRTKGRGGGLRGQTATGDEVDDDWIHARLTRPNRTVFENVFGFSLAGLAEGAKSLEHAELRNVIYGGGLGGTVQPDAILADLRRERDELFTDRGHARVLPSTAKKIAELDKRIRTTMTRADEWQKREAERDEHVRAAAASAAALRERRRELEELRAKLDGIEPARRRAAALRERAGMRPRSALPDDAEVRHANLEGRREALARERQGSLDELARAHETLANLVVDEQTLSREAAISATVAGLERYLVARGERAERARELAALEQRIEDKLASLRRGWDLDRLGGLRVDAVARANFEAAIEAESERVAEEARMARSLSELDDELREIEAHRSALPAAVDVAPLRALLEVATELSADLKAAASLGESLRVLERKHATKLAQLEPRPVVPLQDVVAPPADEQRRFEEERRKLDDRRAHLDSELSRARAELDEAERALREIDPEGRVPTEEALQVARRQRDDLFDAVLAAPMRAREYDRAVRAADELADRMRLHAREVQSRAAAESRRARAHESIARLTGEQEALGSELASHERRWRDVWTGVAPRPSMRAWLALRDDLLSIEAELDELRARRRDLDERQRSLLARGEQLGLSGTLEELRATATDRIAREERRAQEASALDKAQRRSALKREPLARAIAASRDRGVSFAERFPSLLAAVGLEADLAPATARLLLSGLLEARSELLSGLTLRASLATLDAELSVYRARVGDDDVEVAVARLRKDLDDARAAAARRGEARASHVAATRRLQQLDVEEREVAAALDDLCRLAGVSDDAGLAAIIASDKRSATLDAEIAEDERTLRRLFGELPDLDALARFDRPALESELVRVEQSLGPLEDEVRANDRAVGDVAARLAAIDGREDAAEALAEVEAHRARLAESAERYAVLTLAAELLERSIRRFEQEHQPGVLGRASKIFAAMTLGRYRTIRKSAEALVVERVDGVELGPEQLSTGAREQLYLAVRLAYVEHYCRGAEPLPVVLDDVLVNFDERRARATLGALDEFSHTTQVILFTCHARTLALAAEAGIAAHTLAIPEVSRAE